MNLAQPEAIMQGGRDLAPYHGYVAPPWGDLRDGPIGSKVICPRTIEDWQFIPGLPAPAEWLPCDEASGPLIDRGPGGFSYAASGSVTYNQTVTGYALPWVGIPAAGSSGFSVGTAVSYDPGMPVLVVMDVAIASTGGSRTLYTFSPNLLLQANVSGFLQLVASGSTTVAGTFDYRSATIPYRIVCYWEPADAPNGGSIFKLWTSKEQIQITAGGGFGGAITFPGDGTKGNWGAVAPPAHKLRGRALWRGRAARIAANLSGARQGGKFILQRSEIAVVY